MSWEVKVEVGRFLLSPPLVIGFQRTGVKNKGRAAVRHAHLYF
jgi:hypothetical protein